LNLHGAETTQSPVTALQLGEGQEEESQPTPPPRKKKLKKKLEEVLANSVSSVPSKSKNHAEGSTSDEIIEEVGVIPAEQEQIATPTLPADTVPTDHRDSSGDASPKKNRRRKKHGGYVKSGRQAAAV